MVFTDGYSTPTPICFSLHGWNKFNKILPKQRSQHPLKQSSNIRRMDKRKMTFVLCQNLIRSTLICKSCHLVAKLPKYRKLYKERHTVIFNYRDTFLIIFDLVVLRIITNQKSLNIKKNKFRTK